MKKKLKKNFPCKQPKFYENVIVLGRKHDDTCTVKPVLRGHPWDKENVAL